MQPTTAKPGVGPALPSSSKESGSSPAKPTLKGPSYSSVRAESSPLTPPSKKLSASVPESKKSDGEQPDFGVALARVKVGEAFQGNPRRFIAATTDLINRVTVLCGGIEQLAQDSSVYRADSEREMSDTYKKLDKFFDETRELHADMATRLEEHCVSVIKTKGWTKAKQDLAPFRDVLRDCAAAWAKASFPGISKENRYTHVFSAQLRGQFPTALSIAVEKVSPSVIDEAMAFCKPSDDKSS